MRGSQALALSLLISLPRVLAAAEPPILPAPAVVRAGGGTASGAALAETTSDTSTGGSSPESAERKILAWASTGPTFAYGKNFWSISAGAGYFIRLGLAPNIELSHTFSASPSMWIVRPGVTWFLSLPFKPYVGAYYTHWFVSEGRGDKDGFGARVGASVLIPIVSLELTYDHALSCSHDCDAWTPAVSAHITF